MGSDESERLAKLETSLADHIKLCDVLRRQHRFIMGMVFTGILALGGWIWHLHEIVEDRMLGLTKAIYMLTGPGGGVP